MANEPSEKNNKRNYNDERWSAINNSLSTGLKRQGLQRLAHELPEGKGKATYKLQDGAKVQYVLIVAQLIETRRRQQLSQAELAKRAGTTQVTIARIESGAHSPTLTMVCKLVAALDLQFAVVAKP